MFSPLDGETAIPFFYLSKEHLRGKVPDRVLDGPLDTADRMKAYDFPQRDYTRELRVFGIFEEGKKINIPIQVKNPQKPNLFI